MTLIQVRQCDLVSAVIEKYRDTHDFIHSACQMDEWALGYICALRDIGVLNGEQSEFLFRAFQPDGLDV